MMQMLQDLADTVVQQLRADDHSMPRPVLQCNQISMLATVRNGVRSFTVTKGMDHFHFKKPWDAFNVFCLMACPTWPTTSTIGVVVSSNRSQVLFDVPIMRGMYDVPSLRKIGSCVIQVVFFSKYVCRDIPPSTSGQTTPAS